jgi:NAD(P)-dependent dehydrogenase (short-subunit alcohol dehydrogenase family)
MSAYFKNIAGLYGLAGKTAVITGGATGIGRETARLFAHAGAQVVILDINEAEAAASVAEITASGHGAHFIRMDQGDPDSITAAFAQLSRADVLFNCAGIYPRANFETVTPDALDRMYRVNQRGVLLCTQAAVIRMKAHGGGAVINVSSVTALKAGIFDNIPYAMTKSALNAMTLSTALEYAADNIRVNSILPGGIATGEAAASTGQGAPVRGPFMQPGRIPLGSGMLPPREIATAALFLASDAARFITGQLIAVDGGFLIG